LVPRYVGLLICAPCCALLAARCSLTAASAGFAVALGIALGVPDQIFATVTQYPLVAAAAGSVGDSALWGTWSSDWPDAPHPLPRACRIPDREPAPAAADLGRAPCHPPGSRPGPFGKNQGP
jgi:hypothetical protein